MEKVLVISYRFPPADETGTERTWAIAQYLKSMGFFPVFITRNWSVPLRKHEDKYLPAGSDIEYKVEDNYEVITLPFKNSLWLKINTVFKYKFSFIRKAFNFLDHVLMNLGVFVFSEFRPFLKEAIKVVSQRPTLRKAIVIADPYSLFYVGYYLNSRFGLQWIADYRDDWNTREVQDTYGFKPSLFHRFIYKLERRAEKKWVGSASFISSVSEAYTKRISNFVGVEGITIYNGFFEEPALMAIKARAIDTVRPEHRFVIIFNGTLYPTQEIEIFLSGFKRIVDHFGAQVPIIVKFIGITYKPGSKERIDRFMQGYEANYCCMDRIPKLDLYRELIDAQLALLVSHGSQYKGVTTSKIFDYLALKKEVLCCPSDGDVVEKILKETKLGSFCNTEDEVFYFIQRKVEEYLKQEMVVPEIDESSCLKYTRRNQTSKFAELLSRMDIYRIERK